MSSNSDGSATKINAAYLNSLVQYFLQPLLDEVNGLLQNGQTVSVAGASGGIEVPVIDSTLTVPAGSSKFQPAAELVKALGQVGGSVNSDLNWFQQALTDTIDEINTTASAMKSTDDLNAEQAQTLLQDFAGAVSDVNSSPTGSAGGSSSASGGSQSSSSVGGSGSSGSNGSSG